MKIVILGPPGSGKGTQAKFISEHFRIPHISTGEIAREVAKESKEIDLLLKRGSLVPDKTITRLLKDRLAKEDCRKGFILDGYPRNLNQAKMLEEIAKIDAALYLDLKDTEAIKRIGGRLTCTKCHAVYGNAKPPKEKGRCDTCTSLLEKRKDETEQTVRRRLEIFHSDTKPLADYFRRKKLLHEVDANGRIEEIFDNILLVLENI